jgi:hypothetical protein
VSPYWKSSSLEAVAIVKGAAFKVKLLSVILSFERMSCRKENILANPLVISGQSKIASRILN